MMLTTKSVSFWASLVYYFEKENDADFVSVELGELLAHAASIYVLIIIFCSSVPPVQTWRDSVYQNMIF